MLTLFGYALKNLGRQKLRTFLSALGVMLGVWLVVVFSAVSGGILNTVSGMLSQFGEDFHCYKAGVADQFLSSVEESRTRKRLRALPGVRETASVLTWFTRIPPTDFVVLIGLRPGEFALESLLSGGRGGFSGPEADEAIVGEEIARRLKLDVGGKITLEGVEFRVTGTFATGSPLFDNAVVLPLERMQAVFRGGGDIANYIAVKVARGRDAREVARSVEKAMPDLSTVASLEELPKVDQGLRKMRMWSLVITVTATVIGWLFVMLAMVMSVFERTREVGILRAVGWTQRNIVLLVLLEAVFLALLGVAAGIPTGLLGVEVISRITDLSIYIAPSFGGAIYLKAFLVALLAAATGGIYPAWRAARLRPVEAIRHE